MNEAPLYCGDDSTDPTPVTGAEGVVTLAVLDETGRLDRATIDRVSTQIIASLRLLKARGDVRVNCVDDARMASAHWQFSKVEGTTDVLTFDLRDGAFGPLDADILVCVDQAARRAAEFGHPLSHELVLYAVHGVLHCLGEDDHDDAAAARMHRREDEVLEAIGLGRVFAGSGRAGAEGGGA